MHPLVSILTWLNKITKSSVPYRSLTFISINIALRNLSYQRARLITAVDGIAFASFLMAMEGGLLYGFTMAASRVVDAVDADIWIAAKGIPIIDLGSPISSRYREILMAAPDIHQSGRAAVTWAPYVRPDGKRTMVLLVGLDAPFLGTIPSPRLGGIQGRSCAGRFGYR